MTKKTLLGLLALILIGTTSGFFLDKASDCCQQIEACCKTQEACCQ